MALAKAGSEFTSLATLPKLLSAAISLVAVKPAVSRAPRRVSRYVLS